MHTTNLLPTLSRLRSCGELEELLALAAELAPGACGFDRAVAASLRDGHAGVVRASPGAAALARSLAGERVLPPGADEELPPVAGPRDEPPADLSERLRLTHHAWAWIGEGPGRLALLLLDREAGAVGPGDVDAVHDLARVVGLGADRIVLRRRARALTEHVQRFCAVAPPVAAEALDAPAVLPADHGLGPALPRGAGEVVAAARLEGLSPREKRVARLLAEGRSNREIASALGVSPETVKTQVLRIRRKLGAANRVEAIALLLRAPA